MPADISNPRASEPTPISITDVRFDADVERTVLEVIRSGVVAQGPMVKRLEDEFASMIGAEHCVAVNNGTTALIAALRVLDLQPGDEVLTSPFTFVATLNAILDAGATARFVDISPSDFNLDPAQLDEAITDRTKVLMPVHLYGQCADMEPIVATANRHGLSLVEDAAQAHGAGYFGRQAGTFGLGCFSLYATKNLTAGEGGFITTDDALVADRLRVLRNQGMRARYEYEMVGNNFRMTDLNAALCLPQLSGYGELVNRRRANAARLQAGLFDLPGLVLPQQQEGRDHVWHQFTVLVDDVAPVDRDELLTALADVGIGTGVYYPRLVFDYDCYRSDPRVIASDVPVAARVTRQCLSLPVHQHLSESDLDRIVMAVRRVWNA
jgi:dTDP-4-amino-4,6-dideoxygalactose transaminase